MDNAAVLKNNLISRIQNSDDLQFLRALHTIFESSEKKLFQLTTEQEKSIELGRKDILSGNFKPHNEVIKETQEWLKNL